ncbi:hypothetical protein HPB52_008815 [Rhipicephalus sanguineus]|uniref:Uncharacterized protein n=1 Tax=Rhipicephalus sanguineus TaxID=34632 RepID=A0A9D4QHG6_RHISA|nr:hypothetical protein HPB52_008815 [Rhipicephalus sanguineus]
MDFALADQDLVATEEFITDELAASISKKGTAADSSSSDGKVTTLEKFCIRRQRITSQRRVDLARNQSSTKIVHKDQQLRMRGGGDHLRP